MWLQCIQPQEAPRPRGDDSIFHVYPNLQSLVNECIAMTETDLEASMNFKRASICWVLRSNNLNLISIQMRDYGVWEGIENMGFLGLLLWKEDCKF